VTAGTPVETRLPAAFHEPIGDLRPGTTDAPIPAIVSTELRNTSTTAFEIGDTFELTVQARFATFVVTEVRRSLPSLPADRAFIVVPRAQLAAGLIDRPLVSTSLFVRAPDDAADGLRAALSDASSGVVVHSQAERVANLRARPLVEAVGVGFGMALAAAIAYAALAVTISLLLSGSARARETAHLRSLGLNRSQIVLLAILEHAPPVFVAIVAGLTLGVTVGWVVLPGLGLSSFIGSPSDPALTVDVGQLAAITGALVVIVAVGIGLAAWAQRRIDPARAVREGIE
jgi:predicted lysophospholipase L1 biosynthesis ABC-type transport system permease subunit